MAGVLVFAVVLMTGLSVLYWKKAGEKIITASTSVNGQELPICSVETEKKEIAYTFELAKKDGKEEIVEDLLQLLQKEQIKATFFVTSDWILAHQMLAEQIDQQGHELEGLSGQEVYLEQITLRNWKHGIQTIKRQIREITGADPAYFRVAGGEYNNEILRAVYACGSCPVAWSIDSMDWKGYEAAQNVKHVRQICEGKNGEILRFHGDEAAVVETVELLHSQLKKEGYEPVLLSQMLWKDHYRLTQEGRQIRERRG